MPDVESRIIVRIANQEQITDLGRKYEKVQEEIRKLVAAEKDFDAALQSPAIRDAARELGDIEEQVKRLAQSQRQLGASGGQAMIQWSRAIQDFQAAGFAGIVNNLELMVSSLGGPAMLAGVATLVGVFGPPIARKIASMFEEGVKEGTTRLDELEAKLKELEGKKVKLWIDHVEIDSAREEIERLKNAHEELQKILMRQTKPEAESGKAVAEALGATPEARAATEQMVRRERTRLIEGAGDVAAARRDLEAAQRHAEFTRRFAAEPGVGLETLAQADRAERAVADKQEALKVAQGDAARRADAAIAARFRQAREGIGPEQVQAQEWLIQHLRATDMQGGFAAATAIRAGSPAEMARQQREEEEEKRRKAEEREQRQREAEETKKQREIEAQHRQTRAESDRAEREAQRSLNEEIREQDRQDRERQAIADQRISDRERMAHEAMRDPRLRTAVQMAFVQGGTTETIAPQLGQFLAQQGMAPETEAPFVGAAAAGEVRNDLNRRLAGYTAEGMDKTAAFAAIQGEVIQEFSKLDNRMMQMERMLLDQQMMLGGHRDTRQSRGWGQ